MIISEWEVVRYSPADRSFPIDVVCQRLDSVEQMIGREKLGYEFFQDLVADLQSSPTASEWESCGDYSLGDLVVKSGVFYESTANSNNTDPEDDGSSWTTYARFSNTCYETMWTKYLRKIFAYMVYRESLPFATMRAGGGGLTVQERDERGRRAALKSEIEMLQAFVKQEIDTEFRNMNAWLYNDTAGQACASALPDGCLLIDGHPGPAEPIRVRRTLYKRRV